MSKTTRSSAHRSATASNSNSSSSSESSSDSSEDEFAYRTSNSPAPSPSRDDGKLAALKKQLIIDINDKRGGIDSFSLKKLIAEKPDIYKQQKGTAQQLVNRWKGRQRTEYNDLLLQYGIRIQSPVSTEPSPNRAKSSPRTEPSPASTKPSPRTKPSPARNTKPPRRIKSSPRTKPAAVVQDSPKLPPAVRRTNRSPIMSTHAAFIASLLANPHGTYHPF